MPFATVDTSVCSRALEVLRRLGNPFRNYFARNPDDEVCARYHVPELFATQRQQLLAVIDLYRHDPSAHSEVVPILGNKGAGKTHLLHSIKHGEGGGWQLLVTPGTYQKDTDFLEYLLFQVIDTLLGGGQQRGCRPLVYVGEELGRRLLPQALQELPEEERRELFPAPGLGRWARRLGLGSTQAQERAQWLIETLSAPCPQPAAGGLRRRCQEGGLEPQQACDVACRWVERREPRDTAGLMRRHIYQGFLRAALLGDESDLANFLTFGFAELDFRVRPSRQDLVLALFKVLMEIFRQLRVPVVLAFDQLEDLLLVRRADDGRRTAEAFFAGIVQVLHQIDGICFLIFAERGLWNRFVPSLDGYIQDRLNNPVHVPGYGTLKALRLEAPPPELLRRVVEARLRPALAEVPDRAGLSSIFPFTEEQVLQIARTESTLRDMLMQLRHLFDHLVFGEEVRAQSAAAAEVPAAPAAEVTVRTHTVPPERLPPAIKSAVIVEAPAAIPAAPAGSIPELWEQQIGAARQQLEPAGALTGATRELQAGLGAFLQLCCEHGVKVGPWRLQHVVPEWTFGDHPTYGVLTIAHWACKDGQPWKVGIGLFLGRGAGKPKDLEIKLAALEATPPLIDHLILLRPEDDLALTGKSKAIWQEASRRGLHARLEPVSLDSLATLYGFPRFLAALRESLPEGQPLPNLADLLQERCDKLLEQVCMPVTH